MSDTTKNLLNKNKVHFSTSNEGKKNTNLFQVVQIEKSNDSFCKNDIPSIEIKSEDNLKEKTIKEKEGKSLPWTEEDDKLLLLSAKENNEKNWKRVASSFKGRTSIQCSSRYHRIKPGLNKGHFTQEEDLKLISLYKIYGKKWNLIAKGMKNRTGKQVRDRYINSLAPGVNKEKFSLEEDKKILKYYKIFGNSWSTIAKFINGRTGDMIKNRYYSYLKKCSQKENTIFNDDMPEKEKKEEKKEDKNNQPLIEQEKKSVFINTNQYNFQINNIINQENRYFNNNIFFMNNYFINTTTTPVFTNLLFSNMLNKENRINPNNYFNVNINYKNINNNNGLFGNSKINNGVDYYYNFYNFYNCKDNINSQNNIVSH